MAIVTDKPFETMSLADLRAELAQWKAATAPGGSCVHLPIAHDCREVCAAWVARREAEAREARGEAA